MMAQMVFAAAVYVTAGLLALLLYGLREAYKDGGWRAVGLALLIVSMMLAGLFLFVVGLGGMR